MFIVISWLFCCTVTTNPDNVTKTRISSKCWPQFSTIASIRTCENGWHIDDSAWGKLFCFVMTLDDRRLVQTQWSSERVGQSWFWWPLSVGFARTWRAGCRWWQNDWEPFGWTASVSSCCWWSLGAIAEKRPRALLRLVHLISTLHLMDVS